VKEIKLKRIRCTYSDAIALALRFNAPIYTYKNILDKGIYLKANSTETDKDSQEIDDILSNPGFEKKKHQSGRLYIKHSLQELSELLDQAVLQEDYEKQLK
jgi:bifunctional DNase/RNase